jgi:uncharacterized protein (TIGR03437 family)
MIFPRRLAAARSVIAALGLLAIVAFVIPAKQQAIQRPLKTATPQWYRGNTHTHTNNSDGDSSPHDVAERYKSLGYQFVVITDHNKLTDVDSLNAELGSPGEFLVMKGEEVTDSFSGKPVHINGINNSANVSPQHGSDVLGTINNDLAAIRGAGGLAYIAHPNFGYAISADNLVDSTASLFEIYNAHPVVNNNGDATHPSVDQLWDRALTQGKLLYGIAADDEHTLTNPAGALPGRAWVMVRSTSLEPSAISQALASGDFYASTGVTLQDYQVNSTGIAVSVSDNSSATTIDFIGRNGQLLQRSTGDSATYAFTGHEQYVRAKLSNSDGQSAWTQPVYTERLNPKDPIVNGASMGTEPAQQKSVAPGSVASALGIGLASSTMQATREADGSFPSTLAGTSVTVNGRAADIFYVSSNQVNFQVPAETELGIAEVVITNADGVQMQAAVLVADSAPGIFTEEGNGQGKAVVFDLDKLIGKQVMLTDDNLRRFYLYATGVRGATLVQVTINGQPVTVERVRACRGLPGLDQITIVFPDDVANAGINTLIVTTDGVSSNTTALGL